MMTIILYLVPHVTVIVTSPPLKAVDTPSVTAFISSAIPESMQYGPIVSTVYVNIFPSRDTQHRLKSVPHPKSFVQDGKTSVNPLHMFSLQNSFQLQSDFLVQTDVFFEA